MKSKSKAGLLTMMIMLTAISFFALLTACGGGDDSGGGDGHDPSKEAGAAVSTPTLDTKTDTSITVNAATFTGGNPGSQTIEYARNETSAAPSTGWQDGLIFSGLSPSTTYYIFARSKENATHNAGTASTWLSVTTDLAPAAFYGTWTRTQGNYQPYTITITANSFRFQDKDGDFANFASITWTEAANTATVHGASGYSGIFTGDNSNPSLSYSNGFTISGTKTNYQYTGPIPNGFFMALSEDGQTLYVAESSSVYNRARFTNAQMTDSLFTR